MTDPRYINPKALLKTHQGGTAWEFYFIMPEWLAKRRDISDGAELCWGRLAKLSDKGGRAWISYRELGVMLGRCRSTVDKWIVELVNAGLIDIYESGKSEGVRKHLPLP